MCPGRCQTGQTVMVQQCLPRLVNLMENSMKYMNQHFFSKATHIKTAVMCNERRFPVFHRWVRGYAVCDTDTRLLQVQLF